MRSEVWFNNPDDPTESAGYLERYLNYGLTRAELQSGRPIIGIAQTGSDLSPCNRHHVELAKRVREGIREAGGICFEFPVHPIQETGRRPTAALDRNLAYLGLVEILHGYPLDGVVLTIGCDKTTPACLMAAATANIPAIALSVGPMLNGWFQGERTGAGTIKWKARELFAAGEIDEAGFVDLVASAAPSVGYCNTMGTATTLNSLAEVLGMQLPGSGTIPAPYRERGQVAYETGKRIVELVHEDVRPTDIMTRSSFENAVVACSAIGGSTNAPIHLNAIAKHLGVPLDNDDWQALGHHVPLLVNLQPAGEYLGEDFHRAGGVPAVIGELMANDLLPAPDAMTVNGHSIGANCGSVAIADSAVIRPVAEALIESAGFLNLTGNIFDSAIMKLSGVSEEFRDRYLSDPEHPGRWDGIAVVFDGPEDYHARIDDPDLGVDQQSILFMRGAGPIGYPGGAEVVNMQPSAALLIEGIHSLPCIGDGRQSGTSASPSILNASPEAAAGGGLALVRTGDRIRVDLAAGRVDMLVDEAELADRAEALEASGGYAYPESQTPWQEIQRSMVAQFDEGMVLRPAVKYQDVVRSKGIPRNSH